MAAKHSPGPWTWSGEAQLRDYSRPIKGPSGKFVAAALDFNRTDRDDEVDANARLIAAAPELWEALKDLVPLIAATFPQQERVWLEAARAALAKVRGEQEVEHE